MTRDPGLAPERTTLAWHRTNIAAVVFCIVLVRMTSSGHGPSLLVTGSIVALVACILVARSFGRIINSDMPRQSECSPRNSISPSVASSVDVCVMTALLTLAAILSVIVAFSAQRPF